MGGQYQIYAVYYFGNIDNDAEGGNGSRASKRNKNRPQAMLGKHPPIRHVNGTGNEFSTAAVEPA